MNNSVKNWDELLPEVDPAEGFFDYNELVRMNQRLTCELVKGLFKTSNVVIENGCVMYAWDDEQIAPRVSKRFSNMWSLVKTSDGDNAVKLKNV